MAGLLNFTFAAATQLSAQNFAQVAALPAGGSPTQLVSNLSGGPAIVLLVAAAATTNVSGAAGSTTITVAAATSLAVGQLLDPTVAGIAPGTYVQAIAGTTLTLSQPLTAALVAVSIAFFPTVSLTTGVAVLPGESLPLATNSKDHIAYVAQNGFPTQLNLASGT